MTRRAEVHPRALTAYVGALVLAAAATLGNAALSWADAGVAHPGVVLGSVAVVVVVGMHPLTVVLPRGLHEIYLDSAVLVALALLAAPGEALWAFFIGQTVSIAMLRRPVMGSVFNVAQSTVVAAAALAVAGVLGAPSGTSVAEAGALVPLSMTFYAGTLVAGAVFSRLVSGKPIGPILADGVGGVTPAIPLLVDSFGYLAVVLLREVPGAIGLLVAPVVMVLFSSRAFHEAHKDRVRMRSLAAAADAVHASGSPAAVLDAVIGQAAQMLRTEAVEVAVSGPGAEELGILLPPPTAGWLIARRRLSGEPFVHEDEQALRALVNMASTAIAHVDLLAEVRHQAQHDPLTGLANRAMLDQRLGQLVGDAAAEGCLVGVVFVDLDGFKQVNDDFGHHVGDDVLRATADRLRAAVRSSDLVARLGGDEFCVVVPSIVDARIALVVAEKLRRSLHAPFDAAGHTVAVTASVGVAIAPDDGLDAAGLLKVADAGMYVAKRAGKDGVGRSVA